MNIFDDLCLNIYESCRDRKITDDEMSYLIETVYECQLKYFFQEFIMEHGGAHRKYNKLLAKKQKEAVAKEDHQTAQNISDQYARYVNSYRYNDAEKNVKPNTYSSAVKLKMGNGNDYFINLNKYIDVDSNEKNRKKNDKYNKDSVFDYSSGKQNFKDDVEKRKLKLNKIKITDHRKTSDDDVDSDFQDELIESVVSNNVFDYVYLDRFDMARNLVETTFTESVINSDMKEILLSYISEKENDYKVHMLKKSIAEENLGKTLNNKKYKTDKNGNYVNPDKTKKAELKYTAIDKGTETENKKRWTSYNGEDVESLLIKSTKESDIRLLEYMKRKSNSGSPEDIKKYKKVFKMFCVKHGIDEKSSLYVRYDPNNQFKNETRIDEWKTGNKIDSSKTIGESNKHALPEGYILVHRSENGGITELQPKKYSDKYIDSGESGVSGQYHDSGRIYFVLLKDGQTMNGAWGRGSHVYKLISKISGFYYDSENDKSVGNKTLNISQMVGKSVYVKTDKPLKVKEI